MNERNVTVIESSLGPYGQYIRAGNHVFGADESESLGGKNTGPNPYELLLAALGACTSMTIRMYAERKKIPLTRCEVKLRRIQRAPAAGDKVDKFERVITLTGDLSSEQRQSLLDIAERCPVSKTLRQGSEIASILADAETVSQTG